MIIADGKERNENTSEKIEVKNETIRKETVKILLCSNLIYS